ncbi:MAG: hypothetical protein RR049_06740, partial [Angelakisella sp.]
MSVSFDEFVQKAKDVALTAGKLAGDIVVDAVDTSKSKLAEAKLNAKICEVNERLGMIVYEAAKTGKDSLKLQTMLCKELDGLYKALDELRKVTPVSSIEVSCPQCSTKNPINASFCSSCGMKLSPAQSSVPSAEYIVETEIADIAEAEETVKNITDSIGAA